MEQYNTKLFLREVRWSKGDQGRYGLVFSELLSMCRVRTLELGENKKREKDSSWRDLEMSKKDLSLVRRLWKTPRIRGLRADTKWGYIFGGYLRSVPTEMFGLMLSLFRWLPDCSARELIEILKEVNRVSLEKLLVEDQRWRIYLLDLKVLGGFDTELTRDNPFEDYPVDYGTVSNQEMDVDLLKWIDDTVDRIGIKQVKYDFKEFVSFRDAWALPGASVQGTAKKLQVVGSDGSCKSLRVKDKWYATLHLSDKEVEDLCMSERVPIVRPFVKQDEPAACRTVQCYDTWSLIRTSFVEKALDLNMHGQWTSIGMNAEEKRSMRDKLMHFHGDWKLCTDQSGFDVHQHVGWVRYVAKKLFERVAKVNPHMREVIDAELDYFEPSGNTMGIGEDGSRRYTL
mmetsp:Transcript_3510/g.3902  ORF Transcript_3510/g.3902 Transcript_3510/m.3902 type:complete len:399 (+) Transcript_3510:3291-4487(+)